MIEGLLPRMFRKLEIGANLAAKNRLDPADNIPHDAAGADRDAPDQPEMADDFEPSHIIRRGNDHEFARIYMA
jgi:hypothetical protein